MTTPLEDILQIICYGSALMGALAVLVLVVCGLAAVAGVDAMPVALTAGLFFASSALGLLGSLAVAAIVGFCRR